MNPHEPEAGTGTPAETAPAGGAPAEPELWREEFPYTATGEELVLRRDFTRYLLAASGAFAAGAAGAAVWAGMRRANVGEPRAVVDLAEVPEGGDHLFAYPTEQTSASPCPTPRRPPPITCPSCRSAIWCSSRARSR